MNFRSVQEQIHAFNAANLRNVEKVEPKSIDLKEELYIGNLHYTSTHHHNNHCWTMFVSKSPTDVVAPSTIKSVTYYLHETFHPNKVTIKKPPFYLDRRGWGYFEVKADIAFKPEVYANDNATSNTDHQKSNTVTPFEPGIEAVHSIHFGSPIATHHIQTNLPYIVDSSTLQKAVRKLTDVMHGNRLRRRNKHNNDDIDDDDFVTKKHIPEIVLSGWCSTEQSMRESLIQHLGTDTPPEVIDIIVVYASVHSICPDEDGLSATELLKTRVVLENCFAIQFVAYCPVLELVIKNCGGCDVQYSNVERMVRVYNSTEINLYNKGECSGYRFEKCKNINVEALDTRIRVIFMSLFSEGLRFKMFNAYYPNDSSKCVDQFLDDDDDIQINENKKEIRDTNTKDNVDDDGVNEGRFIDGWKKWFVEKNNQCYLTVFRKDKNVALFGEKTSFSTQKGTTLIPLI